MPERDDAEGVGPRTFHQWDFPSAKVLEAKAGRTVSVCIPARDEGSTVGSVVRAVVQPFLASAGGNGLVDEVIVLDDGSSDDTAEQAADSGARVVRGVEVEGGKGQAMAAALATSRGDVVVFLDADVANTTPAFVTGMLGPLLFFDDVALVKGFYTRPLHGEPTGGGRVTELVARPVLELLFPELYEVRQPLAGETAAHRWVFEKVRFADGYGVELGLLIDVAQLLGPAALAQVDLGVRIHRNRPLHELRPQATDVLPGRFGAGSPLTRSVGPSGHGSADGAISPDVTSILADDCMVVSNRGPLSFRFDADGIPQPAPGGGGLVSAIGPLLAGTGATWVSVTMGAADRAAVARGRMVDDNFTLLPVVIDDDTYRAAYDVVSNSTLWYCHHHLFDLPRRPRFDRHWRQAWESYRRYNRSVADTVIDRAPANSTVLVQDYHFSLLGQMLAQERPDLHTVHFCHIPFADPNMLRVLPDAAVAELLSGLAGFSACGFHAHRWEAGFRACYADPDLAALAGPQSAAPPTFVSSLSSDNEGLLAEAASAECARSVEILRAQTGGRRIVLRVDRVEPSKNIVRGMLAFEELLAAYPQWRDKVVHIALVYPSRQGLAEYLAYGAEVTHTAERINQVWGTATWNPIILHVEDDRPRSLAALTISDVLLVNPVRDGLNLVAKEGGLLNGADGVLVLSREAGAWEELAEAALGVNPFDISGTADALHRALAMDPAERKSRADRLRSLVLSRSAADWLADQLAAGRTLNR